MDNLLDEHSLVVQLKSLVRGSGDNTYEEVVFGVFKNHVDRLVF